MEKGDVVEIFEDPVTRKELEGSARLIRQIFYPRSHDTLEYWRVKFLDDGFEAERWIDIAAQRKRAAA